MFSNSIIVVGKLIFQDTITKSKVNIHRYTLHATHLPQVKFKGNLESKSVIPVIQYTKGDPTVTEGVNYVLILKQEDTYFKLEDFITVDNPEKVVSAFTGKINRLDTVDGETPYYSLGLFSFSGKSDNRVYHNWNATTSFKPSVLTEGATITSFGKLTSLYMKDSGTIIPNMSFKNFYMAGYSQNSTTSSTSSGSSTTARRGLTDLKV